MSGHRSHWLVWIGGVVAILAASVGTGAVLVAMRDRAGAPTAEVAAPSTPTLLAAADLRAAPLPGAAAVRQLAKGTRLQLIGRSSDGRWLVASPLGQDAVVGWLPAEAIGGAGNVDGLVVVAAIAGTGTGTPPPSAAAPAATPTPGVTSAAGAAHGTPAPDLPDLVVRNVFSHGNRLGVTVANDGAADVNAPIFVRVNGGAPQAVPVKEGEPLRPGDEIDFVVPGAYVLRPAPVRVTVMTDPPTPERDTANNTRSAIVSPDRPNDLAIVSATTATADGHLQVTIRNNSPVPVSGPVSIAVDAEATADGAAPTPVPDALTAEVDLASGATRTVDFAGLLGVDLTRARVRIVASPIDDVVPANDVYPR